jgi:valyl-tRNA synthetase
VILDRDGKTTREAGAYADLTLEAARNRILEDLVRQGFILGQHTFSQTVPVHERCDTPVNFLVTKQWFIKILDYKEAFLAAADRIRWHPSYMKDRYIQWVENLKWDWLISRQRYFGVPIPVWYCNGCDRVSVAEVEALPVDPMTSQPAAPCPCGNGSYRPEKDFMDTWATSSLTPQIAGQWGQDDDLYSKVFPMNLRPQSHEIIRTWVFYTIVKSHHHFSQIPWKEIAISGWGLAPAGSGKISKSRGGGPVKPMEMIERYSADAVRYWSASTGYGKDAVISEDKIRAGQKLVTKMWNVARFSSQFLAGAAKSEGSGRIYPTDRWILSRLGEVILSATYSLDQYDYVSAKAELETFFWQDLADNYLELAKYRLYGDPGRDRDSARHALYQVVLTTLLLFAPFLPFVTDEIFLRLFAAGEDQPSIHRMEWPKGSEFDIDAQAVAFGGLVLNVLTAVRRFKSEAHLALSAPLQELQIATDDEGAIAWLRNAERDLESATRADRILIGPGIGEDMTPLETGANAKIAIRF